MGPWKLLLPLVLLGSVQSNPGTVNPPEPEITIEEARQRWVDLTPRRRQELWDRYQTFRRLPEETRDRLRQRQERLQEILGRIAEEPDHQERLRRFGGRRARLALRGMARERLENQARVVARALSEARRVELEAIPPERRPHVLRRWVRQELEQRERSILERRGESLPEGSPDPREERRRRGHVLRLRHETLLKRLQNQTEWDRLSPRVRLWIESLGPEAFFQNFPAIERHWRQVGGRPLGPPRAVRGPGGPPPERPFPRRGRPRGR